MTRNTCPTCKSIRIAEILWGLPFDMREIEGQLERQEIVLGGCIVVGDDYLKRECNDCGTRW